MAKPQVATRVDEEVKREVGEYADTHDVTEAEAMRRLLSRGIDYEAGRLSTADEEELRQRLDEQQAVLDDQQAALKALHEHLSRSPRWVGPARQAGYLLVALAFLAFSASLPLAAGGFAAVALFVLGAALVAEARSVFSTRDPTDVAGAEAER